MKLSKTQAQKIADDYNLGKIKKFEHIWWAYGNYVYVLQTSKGKYVLKIHKGDPKFIKYQIEVMDFAERRGLPVPKIIKDKEGKQLNMFQKMPLFIQEFVEGKPGKDLNNKEIKNAADVLAKLLKELRKIKKTGKYTWGKNYQFDRSKFFWEIKKIFNLKVKEEADEIYKELNRLNKKKLRISVIHGDAHTINLILKGNKIAAIIDWDDMHEDFELQEVTNFITHSFREDNKLAKKKLKLFMKYFQEHFSLNENSKKVIYFFMRHRLLCSLCWCYGHAQKQKGEKKKEAMKRLKEDLKFYNNLKEFSLEEFLEIIK